MSVKFTIPADAKQETAGSLSSLTTTEKGSLVGAVNELNSKIPTNQTLTYTPHANVTIVNGGVYRFGNVVFISVRFTVSAQFSGNVLSGLPWVYGIDATTNAACFLDNTNEVYLLKRSGSLAGNDVTPGTHILSGCYICDANT